MHAVSKNIKKLRLQKKLTQEEMAERLFVTRQTVSNWENGKSQPDIDTLIKIAETFNTDTTVLIYGTPDSSSSIKEKKKLIVVASILLVFGIAIFFIDKYAQNQSHTYFNSSPLMLLNVFFLPLFWFMLGWTVIQSLDFFGIVKSIKQKYGKVVHIAALSIVLLYLVFIIPFVIGMIDCWIQWSIYMQKSAQLTESSFGYSWSYPIGFLNDTFFSIIQFMGKQPVIFVIPGLVIRLFKTAKIAK